MRAPKPAVIRIATYNVHKCRGLDRRVSVARITDVISALDADIVAVQEILRRDDSEDEEADQVRFIASALDYHFAFGETRKHRNAPQGNAIFSRLPITYHKHYDITWRSFERRGCLRADIQAPTGQVLHVYNVHLSTSYFQRGHQARRLLGKDMLGHSALTGPRLVMGDFNDWTRGLATRLMGSNFESVDMRLLGRRRTYPGILPVIHLDHFYFDKALHLKACSLHRSRRAVMASDHLPLVGVFELSAI